MKLKIDILKYADLILDDYVNPKSEYMRYWVSNYGETDQFQIGYIDENKKLKLFRIKL